MIKTILKDFDITKMGERCNLKKCKNKPNKEILIYQYTLTKGKNDLATLFVCDEHINSIESLIKKLKKENPQIIIQNDVIEI